MTAVAIIHAPTVSRSGARWARARGRRQIEIRRGRKLVPGSRTRFGGLTWLVLSAGYEQGGPVVHLGELR